jgi:hypothetical protein
MGPKLIQSASAYPFGACFTSTHGWLADALSLFYNFDSLIVFVVL